MGGCDEYGEDEGLTLLNCITFFNEKTADFYTHAAAAHTFRRLFFFFFPLLGADRQSS